MSKRFNLSNRTTQNSVTPDLAESFIPHRNAKSALKRRLAKVLACMVALTGGMTALPASASWYDWTDCYREFVCFYSEKNLTGTSSAKYSARPWTYMVESIDNKASSLWNNTGSDMCFYSKKNFRGKKLKVKAYQWVGALWTVDMDNRISSLRPC